MMTAGHRMNALVQIKLLALPDLVCILARGQHLARCICIQTDLGSHTNQHLMRARTLTVREIGGKQGLFQGLLRRSAQRFCPMQQPVGIKGVVHVMPAAAGLAGGAELEAQLRAALTNIFAVGVGLLGCDAVLFGDVRRDFLALGGHAGVQIRTA